MSRAETIQQSVVALYRQRNVVVLSPHLDDACFSLGGFLALLGGGVLINIFTRSLFLADTPPSRLSEELVGRIRHDEDRIFADRCALIRHDLGCIEPPVEGRNSFDLSHLETDVARISELLLGKLAELAPAQSTGDRPVLFCPLGVGRHVNHCATLEVVLRNLDRILTCYEPVFYEDQPYAASGYERLIAISRIKRRLGGKSLRRNVFKTEWREKKLLVGIYPSQFRVSPSRWRFRPFAFSPLSLHEAFWSDDRFAVVGS